MFCGEHWSTMYCVWTLVHLHYTSHKLQGNHQSLQWNVCAHLINFFSNLVECSVDFSDMSVALL